MKTYRLLFTKALALIAASTLGAAAARAQTPTVITSLPYVITSSGLYVLNSNLNSVQTSGNLIEIKASNVTIDFQGHYIAGAVGVTSQSVYGVRATERSNLTIKNGAIAYCFVGIFLDGNGNANTNAVDAQVDNMRVSYCYDTGIYLSQNPASRITNCQVSQGGYGGTTSAYGIAVLGAGATVENNLVSRITGTAGYGIYAAPGNFVRRNTVASVVNGVNGGIYQDNLVHASTTAFGGGTDGGGNVHD